MKNPETKREMELIALAYDRLAHYAALRLASKSMDQFKRSEEAISTSA